MKATKLFVLLVVLSLIAVSPASAADSRRGATPLVAQPVRFEPNVGQSRSAAPFIAHGAGYLLQVDQGRLTLAFKDGERRHDVVLSLDGTQRDQPIAGEELLDSKTNYLLGGDRNLWREGVANYKRIKMPQVYPGIDFILYGNSTNELEHDFVVAPLADPTKIVLHTAGANFKLMPDGGVLIKQDGQSRLTLTKPVAYQVLNGQKVTVDAKFIQRDSQRLAFSLGKYDRTKPLVIDPVLLYSRYVGGTADDIVTDIAVDPSSNAYVVGTTQSLDFPLSSAYQTSRNGGSDLFITKLNAAGNVVWSTYFGGSQSEDGARVVATDTYAAVMFATRSTDIIQGNTPTGERDFIVATFGPTGSLAGGVRLGGTGSEFGWLGGGTLGDFAIASDGKGNLYFAGGTSSNDFWVLNGIARPADTVVQGGIVAGKLNIGQGAVGVWYTTYVGKNHGAVTGAAVDGSGNLYITGVALPTTEIYPTTGAYQTTNRGYDDGFVIKLNSSGGIVYTTLLGGSGADDPTAIAADSSGNVYVTGQTGSLDWPTVNPYQSACKGVLICSDAFVAKLDPTGASLLYSTYLGGTGNSVNSSYPGGTDIGLAIKLDGSGNIFVAGKTQTPDFPGASTLGIQKSCGQSLGACTPDAFVAEFNPAGSNLIFSTYLGGSGDDELNGMDLDPRGNVYIGGSTTTTFPTAGVSSSFRGGLEGWAARITTGNTGPYLVLNPTSLTFDDVVFGLPATQLQTVTITSAGTNEVHISSITSSADFPIISNNCIGTLSLGSNCSLVVNFNPTSTGAKIASLTVNSDGTGNPQTVSLSANSLAIGYLQPNPQPLSFGYQAPNTSATKTITLTNLAATTATITGITVSVGATSYSQTNNCPSTLAQNAFCTITVKFQPTSAGNKGGQIKVTGSFQGLQLFISLSGNGGLQGASYDTTTLDFGGWPTTLTSNPLKVRLTNTGTASLIISSITYTGTPFNMIHDCGSSLAVGGYCTITVTYTATLFTTQTGTVTVGTGAGTQFISLSGHGGNPYLHISPAGSYNFPATAVGSSTLAPPLTVSNDGDAMAKITLIGFQQNNPDFGVASTTCPTYLVEKTTCTVTPKFNPQSGGSKTGVFTVTYASANPAPTFTYYGAGSNPVPTLTSISPTSTVAGRGIPFLVTLNGTNFFPTSVVSGVGQATVTYVNQTQLTVLIPADYLTTARVLPLAVANPSPGGGQTASINFTVTANNPPEGKVESAINPADQSNTLPQLTPISISGWAGDIDDGSPITKVTVFAAPANVSTTAGIYFSDAGANRVRRIDKAGVVRNFAGNGAYGYTGDNQAATAATLQLGSSGSLGSGGIGGLAGDKIGNIYIADLLNTRVRKVSSNGVITTAAGNGQSAYGADNIAPTSSPLLTVGALAVDANNNLYIAEYGRVRKVNFAANTITTVIGSGTVVGDDTGDGGPATAAKFAGISGLALDSAGNIYTADFQTRHIRVTDKTTGIITRYSGAAYTCPGCGASTGDGGSYASAGFAALGGIAIDKSDNMYIVDQSRIRKITKSTGIITTIAGDGTLGSSGDGGPAIAAKVGPQDITVDSSGNIYFTETTNLHIRKIDAVTGIITTVAGAPTGGAASNDNLLAAGLPIGGVLGVLVVGDGSTVPILTGTPTLNISRPDVVTQTGNANYANSGWKLDSNTGALPAGTYNVYAAAHDTSGAIISLPSTTQFTVNVNPVAIATVNPTSVDFGGLLIGTTLPSAKTVQITNTGSATLTIQSVTVSTDYSQSNNCSSVAPGASCTVLLNFRPTAVGARNGTLIITHNGSTSPNQIALTGSGQDMNVTPARPGRPTRPTPPPAQVVSTISVDALSKASPSTRSSETPKVPQSSPKNVTSQPAAQSAPVSSPSVNDTSTHLVAVPVAINNPCEPTEASCQQPVSETTDAAGIEVTADGKSKQDDSGDDNAKPQSTDRLQQTDGSTNPSDGAETKQLKEKPGDKIKKSEQATPGNGGHRRSQAAAPVRTN